MSNARETSAALDVHQDTDPALALREIKALLREFVEAQRSAPRELAAAELREVYCSLREYARQAGVDPDRALAQYRAEIAKRQPRPVRAGTAAPRIRRR